MNNGLLEKGTPVGSGWCQNIGLNLKFTKSNEEVMGFTRRVSSDRHTPYGGGTWLYSEKCIAVVREYMETFPEMFERLSHNISGDKFPAEMLFGQDKTEQKLNQVLEYLKTVSCANAKKISSNSQILEEQVLVQIQNEIERCNIANVSSTFNLFLKFRGNSLATETHYARLIEKSKLIPSSRVHKFINNGVF